MKTTHQKTEKNTAVYEIVIEKSQIDKSRQKALNKLAQNATIKGFRKGKAPLPLVEKQLDPDSVKHETLHLLLTDLIPEVIKEHNLILIDNPILKSVDDKDDSLWTLQIDFPIKPVFTLPDYNNLATKAKTKSTKDEQIDTFCDSLIQSVDFDVPQSLLEKEVDKSLSRLLEQTQSLGLTVEKYLTSINKSLTQLKEKYLTKATNNLKLELLLLEVANSMKLSVSDTDIDSFISSIGDEKTSQYFAKPDQKPFITSLLLKRKALDTLLTS